MIQLKSLMTALTCLICREPVNERGIRRFPCSPVDKILRQDKKEGILLIGELPRTAIQKKCDHIFHAGCISEKYNPKNPKCICGIRITGTRIAGSKTLFRSSFEVAIVGYIGMAMLVIVAVSVAKSRPRIDDCLD